MKIAILTCGMLPIPAVLGGAVENLIDFYLEYNNKMKLHDITVYSPWSTQVVTHPAHSSDVNHYYYINVDNLKARMERRVFKYFHSSKDYYNYFIEYYFEKVHADLKKKKNYDYLILENCPGYAYKLSQRGYKNLILHLHNDLLNSSSRYHNIIFHSLSKILTVSDFVKGRVSTIRHDNKIQTILNGIDLHQFSSLMPTMNRQKLGLADHDFIIIYSGRIIKEKGVMELINALLLMNDKPKIKLLVLGSSFFNDTKCEDAFMRSLKEKATAIRDRIAFTGFIPYEQVPAYLNIADIAVLPSMWDEPFGLTIVEAMAAGLPLITTRSGGIPEICEGVATIVERKNVVNNLVSAILDLYEHPEKRQQMSQAGLERAKLFDKETYAKNFFSSIEGL